MAGKEGAPEEEPEVKDIAAEQNVLRYGRKLGPSYDLMRVILTIWVLCMVTLVIILLAIGGLTRTPIFAGAAGGVVMTGLLLLAATAFAYYFGASKLRAAAEALSKLLPKGKS